MSDTVTTFYDEYVSQQLKSGVNRRHVRILDWLRRSGLRKDSNVLEIGCGIGTVTSLLVDVVTDGRIVANDLSPKSVATAEKRLSGYRNVTFVAGDVLGLDLQGSFDMIVLPDVLEHIPEAHHAQLFLKLAGLLGPQGQVIAHIPSAQYLEWLHEHDPGSLQIIDQPLHMEVLIPKVAAAGLYPHFLEHYSLWTGDPDAVILVLRKYRNDLTFQLADPEVGWFGRLRRKIHALRTGQRS